MKNGLRIVERERFAKSRILRAATLRSLRGRKKCKISKSCFLTTRRMNRHDFYTIDSTRGTEEEIEIKGIIATREAQVEEPQRQQIHY